ncbi:GrpB family protein [Nocardioides solisilvae]|uniref:GrpB family protein n=1 Tax=Nocardioides solisilvae TaxID=1542435 RepID=UPI000D7438A4|nr:GrpB family protein [Nocardioides solisilvae]
MAIEVVPWTPAWAEAFEELAAVLREALRDVPSAIVEHVGSTSVPGLAAKPVLDVDVVVAAADVEAAVDALEGIGYLHRGDLGVTGREAFAAPDLEPRRHVYVCLAGTLAVRNHLAVRDVLRARDDLRDEYAATKRMLAAQPEMDVETYVAGKSVVLQKVLAESDLTEEERLAVLLLNGPARPAP